VPEDLSKFVESLVGDIINKIESKVEAKVDATEDIIEKVEGIGKPKGRYPRMSSVDRAAKEQRDKNSLTKMAKHAGFCSSNVGRQVLSLSFFLA
jgi:hypothetical protein